jgi:hypothetical protein
MNKLDITKSLHSRDLKYKDDPKFITMLYRAWWVNWRSAEDRRFRLTDKGFDYFQNIADIKFYEIRFPNNLVITNKVIIDLDKFIDCPYYVSQNGLHLTGEKAALQLVLFDGDLTKFGRAKRETLERKSKK